MLQRHTASHASRRRKKTAHFVHGTTEITKTTIHPLFLPIQDITRSQPHTQHWCSVEPACTPLQAATRVEPKR